MVRVCLLAVLLLGAARARADDAPVTPEQRDEALAKMFRHLDDELWKLQDGGSPRRQYSLAVAGWAYLLASGKGGKTLPARKQQIDRIHGELLRYVERIEKEYLKDDKRERRPPPDGFPMGIGALDAAQFVWVLGVAAPFFAECAARGKHGADSKRALKTIATILEKSQQEDGGWGHDDASRPGMGLPPIRIPKPGGGELNYPGTLLAASHCARIHASTSERVCRSL